MLEHIHIKNFAIIDELELELAAGLTVLTGETGAGKSILVDALGLVLGDRADATSVRHGADRAEVSAEFSVADNHETYQWLRDNDLDDDETQCVVRRVVTGEGRSRAFVNGRKVPVQLLKELGARLVDIHGQHEHQSLLRRTVQRQILDGFGDHHELLARVGSIYADWRDRRERLERLTTEADQREERLDLLRHQVRELEALDLQSGELDRLEEEHDRLAHAGRLLEGSQSALVQAYDGEEVSGYQLLSSAASELDTLAGLDDRLRPVADTFANAVIQIREGSEDLRRYLTDLDMDPERRDWVEDRIGSAHQLARKHRVEPGELPGLLEKLQEELAELEDSGQSIEKLETEVSALESDYREAAQALSRARRNTAEDLGRRVTEGMQELGMPGGRFEIAVETDETGGHAGAHGTDRIEFMVSANKGQPVRALTRVASGGELSRISLALQVIVAHTTWIPSMVFDEVDAGIGGGVAEIVGRKLRSLGRSRQVLCVTHLPQVASQGHHHLQVAKHTGDDSTATELHELEGTEQIEELARMLGGMEITETTREHAREMIARAG